MTSEAHVSGTDRIAEVIRRPEYSHLQVIVNVQGDEPEIDPVLIDDLIEMTNRPEVAMATISAPFSQSRDVENPNLVKDVVDLCALTLPSIFRVQRFPFDQAGRCRGRRRCGHVPDGDLSQASGNLRVQTETLLTLSTTPVCELERLEKLEQLQGSLRGDEDFCSGDGKRAHGVDTPDDYAAFVRKRLQ